MQVNLWRQNANIVIVPMIYVWAPLSYGVFRSLSLSLLVEIKFETSVNLRHKLFEGEQTPIM